MKMHISRREFLKVSLMSVGAAYLAACKQIPAPIPTPTSTAQPTRRPTSTPTSTPQPTTRPTVIPYVTTEPYAYYDFADSFEGISDLGSFGITAAQNSVRINNSNSNTVYQTGHQSIEAYGTIAGPGNSFLSIEFDVKKYLGSDSYDLSNKVMVIAVFIPTDSPINQIYLEANDGSRVVNVQTFKIADSSRPWPNDYTIELPKGQWVEAFCDIKDVFSTTSLNHWGKLWFTAGSNGNLTDDETLNVVRNCQGFRIYGVRNSAGNPVDTSFFLDDLRWLERDRIKVDTQVDSLRKYAVKTHLAGVGAFMASDSMLKITDVKYCQVFAQEFNWLSCIPDWTFIEPQEGVFSFQFIDKMVDFAVGNQMSIFGYTGAKQTGLPDWLLKKKYSELEAVLTDYIDKLLQHYRGKVAIWNVYNELVNGEGTGFWNRQNLTSSNPGTGCIWVEGKDTSLIKAAFKQARISDPSAKLILNDYGVEEMGNPKAEFFYNYIKEAVAEGIPIDGVGFEQHFAYPPLNGVYTTPPVQDLPAYLKRVDENIKRYASLGMQVVAPSEIDVCIEIKDINTSTAAGQAELRRRLDYAGQIFGGTMQVALSNPNVLLYNTFDYSDRYSWMTLPVRGGNPYGPGFSYPNMLDLDLKPKPAYNDVLTALKNNG